MPAFFELLSAEENAAVRVVLGHFVFVYIHPYMDGNGQDGAVSHEYDAGVRRLSVDRRACHSPRTITWSLWKRPASGRASNLLRNSCRIW